MMRMKTKRTKTTQSRADSGNLNVGAPDAFPRRVLLAVTGLSPQVVTETLYYLTRKANPAFVPTEVHLLTTAEGAERARLTLLSDDPGWFHRLCRDYGLPDIEFSEETIHALKTADGTPVGDIRTCDENRLLADVLTETIRSLTADPDCALHVSIAGGRKTMGFYAGYALSLFGRPQDRLSHVLVADLFESNREFYYPTPYSKVIHTHDNRPLDTRDAQVDLAEIPFVRLRGGLDDRLLKGTVTFSEVVAAAQRALQSPLLEIDLDRKYIRAGGQQLHLPPTQLAFLSWLARRAKANKPGVTCPEKKGAAALNSEYSREYLSEYAHLGDEVDSSTATRLAEGMDKTFFEEIKAKLLGRLRDALGPEGVRRYGIGDDGCRPKRYRIAVAPENILWLDRTDFTETGKLAKSSSRARTGL